MFFVLKGVKMNSAVLCMIIDFVFIKISCKFVKKINSTKTEQ